MGRNHPLTFSGVEHAVGLSVAHVAALGLAVVLQSAGLAEVVAAPGGGEWKEGGGEWKEGGREGQKGRSIVSRPLGREGGSEGAEHSRQATRAGLTW